MNGIGPLDIIIVLAYFVAIIHIGRRAKATSAKGEESYFLAGRKLGKLYQAFLNFGNATEPQGAVTNAGFVYDKGASYAWYSFQVIFINPYYWFMNVWFRRVRLTTMADLFVDRFGSRWMGIFYSIFQICVAVLLIGFGSLTAYKITASLVTKPESSWNVAEREAVAQYREMRDLEFRQKSAGLNAQLDKLLAQPAGSLTDTQRGTMTGLTNDIARLPAEYKHSSALTPAQNTRLDYLRNLKNSDAIYGTVSVFRPFGYKLAFYVIFIAAVGAYIVLGGMKAAAVTQTLQGMLIILSSIILIPTGLYAIGGWGQLSHKIPEAMFNLFSGSLNGWAILAITLVSLIQMNALSPNMNIIGSAKDETAARMGVVGLYGKRFMIILWTFVGLIAIVLFTGQNMIDDRDTVWGALSEKLLGPIPGMIGLMLAGVIAGVMSNLAAKSIAISALFVRNIFHVVRPQAGEERGVYVARWTIVVVLLIGLFGALTMDDMMSIVQLVITVNVPFGVLIMVMFFWRRLTLPAAWASILLSIALTIVFPLVAQVIPTMTNSPALTQTVRETDGTEQPVFWKTVTRVNKDDPNSALRGSGRFDMENYMVTKLHIMNSANMTARQRENLRYYVTAFLPLIVLIIVSLFTRNRNPAQVDYFYGKMKTPVGATPELEEQAIEETRRNPRRFDHTKLLGKNSSWEFGKWDKQDTVGFIACCAASGAVILIFVGLLKLAS